MASFNNTNFVVGSKRFIRSGMGSIDSIMALTDHYGFKYVYDNMFPRKSKDKMFVDLVGDGEDSGRRMQCGGDMEDFWRMFDHVNGLD